MKLASWLCLCSFSNSVFVFHLPSWAHSSCRNKPLNVHTLVRSTYWHCIACVALVAQKARRGCEMFKRHTVRRRQTEWLYLKHALHDEVCSLEIISPITVESNMMYKNGTVKFSKWYSFLALAYWAYWSFLACFEMPCLKILSISYFPIHLVPPNCRI